MTTALEATFEFIRLMSWQLQEKHIADGLPVNGNAFWQPIKIAATKYNDELHIATQWNFIKDVRNTTSTVTEIMALPEFLPDGKINEVNHFRIQAVRLPATNKVSLQKILQIALNLGQLEGILRRGAAERLPIDKYLLSLKLNNYLTDEDIAAISSQLTEVMIRGILGAAKLAYGRS